jgi:hypothetical protein
MKLFKNLSLACIVLTSFISCNSDDDAPVPVNEEELITSVVVNLVGGGTVVSIESRDLDGDGPNDPVISVSGNLTAGVTYEGSVIFLNESVTPIEDITLEVEEEADEHQVMFVLGTGLDGVITYENNDSDGNPLGTQFTLTPNAAGTGNFTVVLRHEPTKPNDGTLNGAGGETDVSATFDLTFEN